MPRLRLEPVLLLAACAAPEIDVEPPPPPPAPARCDDAVAKERADLEAQYRDTVHPLIVRPIAEGGCAECHAPGTSHDLIVWPDDAARTFEAMWAVGLLDTSAPPRSLLAVLAEDGVPRMPLGRDAWPEEERAAVEALACDLKASAIDAPPVCDGPPDPGHVPIRRLSSTQYATTVASALGYRGPISLVPDEIAFGFDSVAVAQRLSTGHVEQYAEAAERIAGDTLFVADPLELTYEAEGLDAWLYNGNRPGTGHGGPVDTDGDGVRDVYHFQRIISYVTPGLVEVEYPGRYAVTMRVQGYNADQRVRQNDVLVTTESNVPPELRVDFGTSLFQVVEVPGDYLEFGPWMEITMVFDDVPAGPHEIRVGMTNMGYGPNRQRDVRMRLDHFSITGPAPNELPATDRMRVDRYLVCPDGSDPACNTRAVENVLATLWRRVPDAAEVERYETRLLDAVLDDDGTFRDGMELVLEAALLSPHFLYRVELPGHQAERVLDGYELATRLSYFLWSGPPDATLLARAADGTLLDDAILEAEIDRMLADERADALVHDFGAQWLGLRRLDTLMLSAEVFPELDEDLRRDLATELERLLDYVMRGDRDLRELLDTDVTWVNDRLAAHYGLPAPGTGETFVEVPVGDAPRGGLLESGGVHALTSHPDRTSPTLRGKWILDNLLCQPPAEPPADADTNIQRPGLEDLTLRERLEQHRVDPACAACHAMMDPLGMSMEHFDALGRWRTTDDFGDTVDPTAEMPDGTAVTGHTDVLTWLDTQPAFDRCVTKKLATYALGRDPTTVDACALDAVRDTWTQGDRSLRGLVKALATSPVFRARRDERTGEYDHLTGGP
ncbi:MAG: DUF1592 domain-containing protein [Deltaproteobacteria bacterium]